MQEKLNAQIKMEFGAQHAYLAMAAYFEDRNLKIFADIFWKQAAEEATHAMKLVGYMQDAGARPEFRGVQEPQRDFDNVEAVIKKALGHEQAVTDSIHDIVKLADDEKDYATRGMLQWFVDEQVEEIDKMTTILDLVKMAGEKNVLVLQMHLAHVIGGE
jgi:ferritin